jgi:hypothetical protein
MHSPSRNTKFTPLQDPLEETKGPPSRYEKEKTDNETGFLSYCMPKPQTSSFRLFDAAPEAMLNGRRQL